MALFSVFYRKADAENENGRISTVESMNARIVIPKAFKSLGAICLSVFMDAFTGAFTGVFSNDMQR